MNLCVTIDENYLFSTKCMLKSFAENTKFDDISLFVLHDNIPNDKIDKLDLFCKKNNIKLNCINMKDKIIGLDLTKISQFPMAAYYRLLMPFVLPDNMERALYLDVDMIVLSDLTEFYFCDFDDNYALVCEDYSYIHKRQDLNYIYKKKLVSREHIYFNAGMLLFNLKKTRNEFSVSDILDLIEKNKQHLLYPDQDILNMLWQNKVKYTDFCYNHQVYHSKTASISKSLNNSVKIIHYIGKRKPWMNNYYCDFKKFFWKYAREAGFTGKYIKFTLLNWLPTLMRNICITLLKLK